MASATPAPAPGSEPSAATSPATVSPGGSDRNSLIGAPPASPGECALGGSAGSSSTPSRISRPREVTTPTVPRAVEATAETIASCAARGPPPDPLRAGPAGSWAGSGMTRSVRASSPADESSTVHGSSATSMGTAAVLAAPLLSSSTVRRGVANFSLISPSSADTTPRSRGSESRISVSSAISRCRVSRSRSSSSRS